MSARRAARARIPVPAGRGGPTPECLLIGRCIEVWSQDGGSTDPYSTFRRFNAARRFVLNRLGVTEPEASALIPQGSPWSVEYLTYRGQAERAGRPLDDIVSDRLRAAGCTRADPPWLREQALDLLAEAEHDLPHRSMKGSTT